MTPREQARRYKDDGSSGAEPHPPRCSACCCLPMRSRRRCSLLHHTLEVLALDTHSPPHVNPGQRPWSIHYLDFRTVCWVSLRIAATSGHREKVVGGIGWRHGVSGTPATLNHEHRSRNENGAAAMSRSTIGRDEPCFDSERAGARRLRLSSKTAIPVQTRALPL
jgi:hypothetical protein